MAETSFEVKGNLGLVSGTLKTIKKDSLGVDYEAEERVDNYPVLIITGGKSLFRIFQVVMNKPLEIVFKVFRTQRSAAQNRYCWGVVVPTVRAWLRETQGIKYEPDEVYTWLRVSILGYKPEIRDVAGEDVVVMTGKRFSAMTTKEFADAIDTILSELAERGCIIPEPRQSNFLHEYLNENIKDE